MALNIPARQNLESMRNYKQASTSVKGFRQSTTVLCKFKVRRLVPCMIHLTVWVGLLYWHSETLSLCCDFKFVVTEESSFTENRWLGAHICD